MRQTEQPPEPWRSFFAEVDASLTEDVHLHCRGGFVVTQLYGVARTTSDVDFLAVVPNVQSRLTEIAGKGSPLHRKHKLYLDAVTVAIPPEDYEHVLQLAKNKRVSASWVVRDAVAKYLAEDMPLFAARESATQ